MHLCELTLLKPLRLEFFNPTVLIQRSLASLINFLWDNPPNCYFSLFWVGEQIKGKAAMPIRDLLPPTRPLKKSTIEVGINYVSYFMGSMELDARARLKVNEIVPCVGLHWIYTPLP